MSLHRSGVSRCVVSLLMVLALASAAFARDQFEGSWKITLNPDDGIGKSIEDMLTFKNDTLTSQTFEKRGFAAAAYELDSRRGPVAAFTATSTSEKEGALKWTGTTTGQDIRGSMTWTKKDGSSVSYTFTGTREQK
jgi:hypothetical protein